MSEAKTKYEMPEAGLVQARKPEGLSLRQLTVIVCQPREAHGPASLRASIMLGEARKMGKLRYDEMHKVWRAKK